MRLLLANAQPRTWSRPILHGGAVADRAAHRGRKLDGQQLVDDIVRLAHEHPKAAVALIGREPGLATASSRWGESALQASSHLGHRSLLSHLRDIGVEFDLFAACAFADQQLIEYWWRRDSPNALGVHALPVLHFGIVSRDLLVVEMLIDLGASINHESASLSPLHSAVAIGSAPMVRRLLCEGASALAIDAFGATAFDWAASLQDVGSELLACFQSAILKRA